MASALPFPATALDEASIVAEAQHKTGLSDFGDERFREPMRRLLHSLDREAKLSEGGRAAQRARVVGSLITRLSAEAFIARHPEILEQEIGGPLVIVGYTRSGTTRLHRLLAQDPRHHAVLWWENRSPVPWPGSDWRRDDPRLRDARYEVRRVLESVPELASIHPWDAEGADEDALLMEHAFLSWVPEASAHVPSYRAFMDRADHTPAYQFLERMLKILQWQKRQRGERGDRWVLKTPMHNAHLDTLCRVFPGARLLQTHRDPLESVPSAASMYAALWELASDQVDRKQVGDEVRLRQASAMAACLAFRDRFPERFCDVWYEDMQRDPLRELSRVYAWLGIPLPDEIRRRFQAWLVENAREKRPAHRYTLEEFGLTEPGLAADYAFYRERFILSRRG